MRGFGAQLIVSVALVLSLSSAARLGSLAKRSSWSEGSDKYIIASFPKLHEVNYARLPDPTWRPLVPVDGLKSPEAIAIDRQNHRLFVADPSVGRVYWYQLILLADGRLATDGQMHLAIDALSARGLAVDGVGNLYASGRNMAQDSISAVFKQDAIALSIAAKTGVPPQPVPIWTRLNTAPVLQIAGKEVTFGITLDRTSGEVIGADLNPAHSEGAVIISAVTGGLLEKWNHAFPSKAVIAGDLISSVNGIYRDPFLLMDECNQDKVLNITVRRQLNGAISPQLFEPSAIAVEPFHIYWGNSVRGPSTAAVVEASVNPPDLVPESMLRPLADNVPQVTSMAWTPTYIFYAAKGGIYGVPQSKNAEGCGANSVLCPKVATAENPTGLVWDGESTVYVADRTKGGIYSFASGTITRHVLEKVSDARGVFGLALLAGEKAGTPRQHQIGAATLPLVIAAFVMLLW